MTQAQNSIDGEVIVNLFSRDSLYAVMDSSSILQMKFANIQPIQSGYIRDYIFDITGKYGASLSNKSNTMHQNSMSNPNTQLVNLKPSKYLLHTNYPNPFNPTTQIKYDIPNNGIVKISIYDILGRLVQELVNDYKEAGSYSVDFNGSNLASGIYIYKIETNEFVDSKKMVLIK